MKEDETIQHEGKLFEKIQWQDKSVSGRKFIDCTFRNCQLNGLNFSDCHFADCKFEDCDLSLIKVKGSFFSRLQIIRCKAIGIHWFDVGAPFSVQFSDSSHSTNQPHQYSAPFDYCLSDHYSGTTLVKHTSCASLT